MRASKKNTTKKVVESLDVVPTPIPEQVQAEIIPPFEKVEDDNKYGAFEIMPGMTIEEMKGMFFSQEALIEAPYKVFQLNSKGHRYYYRFDENGEPEFYPSVTTILSQTLPTSPFLIEWIAKNGVEESERYKSIRASYGTFMHAQFESLLINRMYDLDSLKLELKKYIEVNRLPDDFIYEADELKKDILAFARFVLDYDVKPLAVEIALVHPDYGYAGMLDCPCTMLKSIGSKERINAIIDFKSGRKGFYESSEIQLHMYKELWNVNFEKYQIDKVFNFAPKDWRKYPTYNLKDQTDSPNAAKIPALLRIAAVEDEKIDNVFTSISGSVCLDDCNDLNKNIISLTLSELIKSKAPKDITPDDDVNAADDIKNDVIEEKVPTKEIKRKVKSKKTSVKAQKKAHKTIKHKKVVTTPTKKDNPLEVPKKDNKDLLNDNIDF